MSGKGRSGSSGETKQKTVSTSKAEAAPDTSGQGSSGIEHHVEVITLGALPGVEEIVNSKVPFHLPPDAPMHLWMRDETKQIVEGRKSILIPVVTQRRLALKTLTLDQLEHNHKADDAPPLAAATNLVQEISRLKCLKDKNLVDFVHCEPIISNEFSYRIFMEFIDGRTLHDELQEYREKKKTLGEEKIRSCCKMICSAMVYLHSRNPPIIHRNIKPSKMMIEKDTDTVKLIDFGLSIPARFLPAGFGIKSPEMMGQENPQFTTLSDIWAFGLTVYEMCTLKPPCLVNNKAPNLTEINVTESKPQVSEQPCLVNNKAPNLTQINVANKVSDKLVGFYLCCVKEDPNNRWSAAELLTHQFLKAE